MTPEAKAREIAERHAWSKWTCSIPDNPLLAAIEEALHFQPLPEWSETMEMTEPKGFRATPTKPDELLEFAMRNKKVTAEQMLTVLRSWSDSEFSTAASGEFCEDLKGCLEGALARAQDEVARLLVRIKELEGPKEDPDLVLAREMAAQYWENSLCPMFASESRAGNKDDAPATQSALRTIKHLRDAGWKEG